MRPVGYSTGALAYADFRRGLSLARAAGGSVVELSALRQAELFPLLDSLDALDVGGFDYVSVHAPSRFENAWEAEARDRLLKHAWRGWPVVIHPDAIGDFSLWRDFGRQLCVENMDKRKPVGRSAAELADVFDRLPDASLCFDIGHSRQCDPTMTEASGILRQFGHRLRQVHISEVNTSSKHDVLSFASIRAFQSVANLIPETIPVVLETPVQPNRMEEEITKVREALSIRTFECATAPDSRESVALTRPVAPEAPSSGSSHRRRR